MTHFLCHLDDCTITNPLSPGKSVQLFSDANISSNILLIPHKFADNYLVFVINNLVEVVISKTCLDYFHLTTQVAPWIVDGIPDIIAAWHNAGNLVVFKT